MEKISLIPWAVLWMLGGTWLAQAAFRLARRETLLVGLALGILLQTLLANTLARLLPLTAALWLAGGLLLLGGAAALALTRGWRELLRLPLPLEQIALFFLLFGLAFALNRGLPLFDDYAHLPTVSLLAAGQVPPRFALDPSAPYAYHYFLLFFTAQVVRLGGLAPWLALDMMRALVFALGVMLAALWAQRVTRSTVAAWAAGFAAIFLGGTRWLLLFLSEDGLQNLAAQVQMIGSGAASGPNLAAAMGNPWAVEGSDMVTFPFAFGSGLFSPGLMTMLGPNSLMVTLTLALLLLTASRWRGWLAALVSGLVLAALSFITEGEFLFLYAAFGLMAVVRLVRAGFKGFPPRLGQWLAALAGGALLGIFQGGAVFDVLLRLINGESSASYHAVSFSLHAAPTLISRQLGVLSLVQPAQLLAALAEAGPLLLALPLLLIFAFKAWRIQRWFEAAVGLGAALSLGMLFIYYSGSEGEANTTRLYFFLQAGLLFAVPLAWLWLQKRLPAVRGAAVLLGLAACLGGLVMFANSLFGLATPSASYYLDDQDGLMYARHWDELAPNALVFDEVPSRAPVVFGRYTSSSSTWYTTRPEWQALAANPLPTALQAAGFDYLYADQESWRKIQTSASLRAAWAAPCVRVLDEVRDPDSENLRILLALDTCIE